ncbi:MAG: FAD-dependent oxidoreductase [Bacteroidetes bacterium]|nr:FAD-dependent oxidoreductase [Bacteroidota bacterium]MDA0903101.1 FAD-dependent oxidoreductase [Bacteroidota bacterium]MDA1242348.1 FAD-dependent oxidoreductase [Bacteroidota bacterium]
MASSPKNKDFRSNSLDPGLGFSWWELRGWLGELDALVVGGGLVGMTAALHMKTQRPKGRIVIIDRQPLGGGGSTRNAGFACFGSPSELAEDILTLGEARTAELVAMRWRGLQELRHSWGDEALGYQASGSVELFTNSELQRQVEALLPRLNELLTPVLGESPFHFASQGSLPGIQKGAGLVTSPCEGLLDTAKTIQTMRRALVERDIPFLPGLPMTSLESGDRGWRIGTPSGVLESRQVLLATNALAAQWLDLDVQPVDNHVLVSAPLPELTLTHTVHHDRGYVYARRVEDRLLIGGGRQWGLDARGVVEALTAWAQTHLHAGFTPSHHWVGTLGVGQERWPIVDSPARGLHVGVRMGGMGVAIGSLVGRQLAELALGE